MKSGKTKGKYVSSRRKNRYECKRVEKPAISFYRQSEKKEE